MLAGQVLSALRARGQATLEASVAHATGSSPRPSYELDEAVDPINEGPGERPPCGPGLPPSIHASGVDCWTGLVERLVQREFCTAVDQVGRSVALIDSSSIRRGEPPAEAVFWEGYRATLTKTTMPVVGFMQEISVRAASVLARGGSSSSARPFYSA